MSTANLRNKRIDWGKVEINSLISLIRCTRLAVLDYYCTRFIIVLDYYPTKRINEYHELMSTIDEYSN
jgi:hypothetical protein